MSTGIHLQIDIDTLKPLLRELVAEAVAQIDAKRTRGAAGNGSDAGQSPLLVDTPGAAELLSCHPNTVADMVRRGELTPIYLGTGYRRRRGVRFAVAELQAWIERGLTQAKGQRDGGRQATGRNGVKHAVH